jgi:hypothetical protein
MTGQDALDLAAQGWRVFPCMPRGEKAKAPLTFHGHVDATTDPDQIKTWWTRWPDAMIGAAVPDSCIVVDVDPRNGGDLAELETLTGPLPPTLTAWSGRDDGGRHLYFLRPPGPLTSTRLPKGIDLKINGYCIVPRSIHPATGQPYRWEEHPVGAVPVGLRELLRPAPQPVTTYVSNGDASAAGLVRTVASAPEGKRNDVLYWAARRAGENGILDQVAGELFDAAVSAGETQSKARRTIESARKATS